MQCSGRLPLDHEVLAAGAALVEAEAELAADEAIPHGVTTRGSAWNGFSDY